MYSGKFSNIFIYNNIFKANLNVKSWGVSVCLENVDNYQVYNNITVDCRSEHRKIKGGRGVVDYNMAWNSDGSNFSLTPVLQQNELKGIDPAFVIYTGQSGENDYHLKPGSPAIDAGKNITDVLFDFEGTKRPQAKYFDIGPFEFKKAK
jgi:hypothetical protein